MLLQDIERSAKIAKSLMKDKRVRVFSQFDADGISSAAILAKSLFREGVVFELSILKQLTEEAIGSIEVSENDFFIFSDFGSGQLDLMTKILDKTNVLVLDHHEPVRFNHFNLIHVNPLLHGEDEMSASVICYMFAKFLNPRNVDLVDMAIVGAVADEADEGWEFKGTLKKILEEAEMLGKVSVFRGLRLYGRSTRPIYKSLAYTFDPYIPGISGSESQAVQFVSNLGIKVRDGDSWVTLKDLSHEEQQKLATAIIFERMDGDHVPHDIFGDIYTLVGRPEEIQDVRELATLVNACGRTGNHDLACRLLMGDHSVLENCQKVMEDYRRLLGDSMSWVKKRSESVIRTHNATYIIAEDHIPESVIGTITSILSNSELADSSKPVFGMAYSDNGVKISARLGASAKNINLREVIFKAVEPLGGEAGGHMSAAGGYIPRGKEQEFIKRTETVLGEMIGNKEVESKGEVLTGSP